MKEEEHQALKMAERGGTLSDLVDELAKRFGFRRAAMAAFKLYKEGAIELVEPVPYTSALRFLFSVESTWFWALTGVVCFTLWLVLNVEEPPLLYARYVLGSLFVLYLPGYTLIEALFPRQGDLGALERLALSLGLSLAVVPLVGLLLNYTPWGIRLEPVVASLALLTEGLGLMAVARKHRYHLLKLEALRT